MAPTNDELKADIDKLRSEFETFRNDAYAKQVEALDKVRQDIADIRNAGYVTSADLGARLETVQENMRSMEARITTDYGTNEGALSEHEAEHMRRVLRKYYSGDTPDLQDFMNDRTGTLPVPGARVVVEETVVDPAKLPYAEAPVVPVVA